MGNADDDRLVEPTGDESEDETIALSKDELDDILSEAEIVSDKKEDTGVPDEGDVLDLDAGDDLSGGEQAGDEFDISEEIDELTAEDLESIELEEDDLESYRGELEGELGESGGKAEMGDLEAGDMSLDSEQEPAEPTDIEDLDLDLDSIITEEGDVEVPSLDDMVESEEVSAGLGEEPSLETTLDLEEPPTLGEEDVTEGLEGLALGESAGGDEFAEIDLDSLEGESGGEETLDIPEMEEDLGEFLDTDDTGGELRGGFDAGLSEDELEGVEEGGLEEIGLDTAGLDEPVVELTEDESVEFEGVQLSTEEDEILSEDMDLEQAIDEDVVTVTGEELDAIAETEPGERVSVEEGDQVTLDSALYNDIAVVLKYMDTLLGSLSEDKVREFSQSRYFPLYKEVFEKLNLT